MTGSSVRDDLGEVEAFGGELVAPRDRLELGPPLRQRPFERVADPVEGTADLAPAKP